MKKDNWVAAQRGSLNIVNEEGDWNKWSKTLSSQILSKQLPPVAKAQLNLALSQGKEEYDEIMALTNPVVKKTNFLPLLLMTVIHHLFILKLLVYQDRLIK